MDFLDPKNDLVFKLLLTRRKELLLDMLQAILARPIRDLTVLNPAIPGDLSTDKQIILDIRALLADGSRADLEMQMRTPPELAPRLLFYAARDYASQLRRGDGYHLLTPTISIVWLVEPLFPRTRPSPLHLRATRPVHRRLLFRPVRHPPAPALQPHLFPHNRL